MKTKLHTFRFLLPLFLSILFLISIISGRSITASAGVVQNQVSTDKTIANKSDWRISDGVEVTDKGIKFASALATARAVRGERLNDFGVYGIEKCFSAEVALTIGNLPEDRLFGMMFGLPYISNAAGTKGSSMFYLMIENGDFYCGLNCYAEDNIPIPIIEKTILNGASVGDSLELNITVNNDGSAYAAISKKGAVEKTEISCAANEYIGGDGYFGFGQIGGNGETVALVSSAVVNSYRYETPENASYGEAFEKDTFNIGVFTAGQTKEGGSLIVSNNQLIFSETAAAFISTRYDYSNVVLDFDVAWIREESAPIVIAIGAQSCDVPDTSPALLIKIGKSEDGAATEIVFQGKYGTSTAVLPSDFNLWNQDVTAGRPINVRIYSVDGNVRVLMKYSDETGFYQVAQFATEQNTPLGKVQIQGMSGKNSTGNFALSYIGIGNLDVGAQEVTLEFISSDLFVPPDYDYKDSWKDEDLPFGGAN